MAVDPGAGGGGSPSTPSVTYSDSISGTGGRLSSVQSRQTARTQKVVQDTSGTQLVGADAAGFGLDRPYLDWRAYRTVEETTPADSTSSGSFVALVTLASEPQHPKIRVRFKAITGASTSGEVRLRDRATGTVIAGPFVVGSGVSIEGQLEGALISPTLSGSGAPMKVDVEARVTDGASTIAVLVLYALGKGG